MQESESRMGICQRKKWPRHQEGYLPAETQEWHAKRNILDLDSDGINLEDVRLRDSIIKEYRFCDLQ